MDDYAVAEVLIVGALTTRYPYTVNSSRPGQTEQPLRKLLLIRNLHHSSLGKPLVDWNAWFWYHGPITVSKLFKIMPIVVLSSCVYGTELFI